jgi:hypothetical protein
MRFGSGLRTHFGDLPVGHVRKTGEHVAQFEFSSFSFDVSEI